MQHYQSKELLRTNILDGYRKSKVLAVNIGEVNIGDIIQVSGQFQVSSESSSNVHVACQLGIDGQVGGSENMLEYIGPHGSINVTPNMHHYTETRVGVWTADQYIADAWVKLIGWSAQGLDIDAGRGQLDVLVYSAT
ncbi:MAG TPA: hypothetical protein VD999_07875 [Vitreimonas sp.]|nr:hypothetical protein [Vitreimonas sp.]